MLSNTLPVVVALAVIGFITHQTQFEHIACVTTDILIQNAEYSLDKKLDIGLTDAISFATYIKNGQTW